ncbi:MAG: hypothetical protein JRG97_07610 [Deltaproteobacteria bacterium]|nr:hypothetical protein [Deltaproteobacteria bacterium]
MPRDTFVTIDDIPVMYVAGEKGRPIPEQAPEAFRELEAKLPSLKGRKFYGVEFAGEYRACAAIRENDDPSSLPHPAWVIPGGKYVRRFEALVKENDIDPDRPFIEYYRSQRELFIMVPVK